MKFQLMPHKKQDLAFQWKYIENNNITHSGAYLIQQSYLEPSILLHIEV